MQPTAGPPLPSSGTGSRSPLTVLGGESGLPEMRITGASSYSAVVQLSLGSSMANEGYARRSHSRLPMMALLLTSVTGILAVPPMYTLLKSTCGCRMDTSGTTASTSTGSLTVLPPRTFTASASLKVPGVWVWNVTSSSVMDPTAMRPILGSHLIGTCSPNGSRKNTASNDPVFLSVTVRVWGMPTDTILRSSAFSRNPSCPAAASPLHLSVLGLLPPTMLRVSVTLFSSGRLPGLHVICTGMLALPSTEPVAGDTVYAAPWGMSHVNAAGYVLGLLTMMVSVTMESQLSAAKRKMRSSVLRFSVTGTTSAVTSKKNWCALLMV
mmetsp:Transcript_18681/g.46509  ORF Transcript_18681/g.46509 Transcript_18681/m.46509 type:complete len:324 (-) Transcript_18681:2477-3448(-)